MIILKFCVSGIKLFLIPILSIFLHLSCMDKDNDRETLTIGRIMFDLSHPYQKSDAMHFESFLKSLDINSIIVDGQSDPHVIKEAMLDLIEQKVDGIVFQGTDRTEVSLMVDEAHKAGIPVSTFFIPGSDSKAPHVQIDEKKTAREMGMKVAGKWKDFYPDKPIRVAVINQNNVYVEENRVIPFLEGVLYVDPSATIVARINGDGQRDKSYLAGKELLKSHKDVNTILGINADSTLGALEAFESEGRGKAINGIPLTEMFVSIDGTLDECIKIMDPVSALKVTMVLSPRENAVINAVTILKTISGEYKMDQGIVINTYNSIIDYWEMDVDEVQEFLYNEYFSTINLKEEIDKLN